MAESKLEGLAREIEQTTRGFGGALMTIQEKCDAIVVVLARFRDRVVEERDRWADAQIGAALVNTYLDRAEKAEADLAAMTTERDCLRASTREAVMRIREAEAEGRARCAQMAADYGALLNTARNERDDAHAEVGRLSSSPRHDSEDCGEVAAEAALANCREQFIDMRAIREADLAAARAEIVRLIQERNAAREGYAAFREEAEAARKQAQDALTKLEEARGLLASVMEWTAGSRLSAADDLDDLYERIRAFLASPAPTAEPGWCEKHDAPQGHRGGSGWQRTAKDIAEGRGQPNTATVINTAKCNGYHAANTPCGDKECWQRDECSLCGSADRAKRGRPVYSEGYCADAWHDSCRHGYRDCALCGVVKPTHFGNWGYAAEPIRSGIVHDPHCCASRGCHKVCSHLCGTELATHGCCENRAPVQRGDNDGGNAPAPAVHPEAPRPRTVTLEEYQQEQRRAGINWEMVQDLAAALLKYGQHLRTMPACASLRPFQQVPCDCGLDAKLWFQSCMDTSGMPAPPKPDEAPARSSEPAMERRLRAWEHALRTPAPPPLPGAPEEKKG